MIIEFTDDLDLTRWASAEEAARIADDREACQDLATFVRLAWPHFDPAPYRHNWHIEAIAEHLEAVTAGDIKRLIINLPPRHMKSSIVLLWQAWTWTLKPIRNRFNLLRGPGVQFLCTAYNNDKAQDDGTKVRNLLREPWFQARWGHYVKINKYIDNQEQFNTTAGGHRISVGVPQSRGKGGIIRCFPADQLVQTEHGPCAIGDIVAWRMHIRVPSLDTNTGVIALKPVVGWHRNPTRPLVRVTLSNGLSFRCTADHKIALACGGFALASHLLPGTALAAARAVEPNRDVRERATLPDLVDSVGANAKTCGNGFGSLRRLNDFNCLLGRDLGAASAIFPISCQVGVADMVGRKANALRPLAANTPTSYAGYGATTDVVSRGEYSRIFDARGAVHGNISSDDALSPTQLARTARRASGDRLPISAAAYVVDAPGRDAEPFSQYLGGVAASRNLHRLFSGQFGAGTIFQKWKCAVAFGISDVLRARSVFEVAKSWVGAVAVFVAHFLAGWRRPNKSLHDQLMDESIFSAPINPQTDARVANISGRGSQQSTDVVAPLTIQTKDDAAQAFDAPHIRNLVSGRVCDWAPDFWHVVSVNHDEVVSETFCLEVEDNHTFMVCGRENPLCGVFVSNCVDDLHKGEELESAAALEKQIRDYNETWGTRSNDAVNGAEVIVMQRLAANDLTGHVLGQAEPCTHLCLPFEYDPERHCTTVLGWHDPRGCDDDTGEPLDGVGMPPPGWCDELRERQSEPIWPDQFPLSWGRAQEAKIGAFGYSAQYQQIPAPRGGGLIKSDFWRLWDKPVFPAFDVVVVSYDGAYTDKNFNDPSAATAWGRFYLPDIHQPQFMLLWGWAKRLQMHEAVETLHRTCLSARGTAVHDFDAPIPDGALKADHLLIEAKANGISVGQELRRLYGKRRYRTWLITPKGDKTARLLSVQHLFVGERQDDGTFAPGQIWAPDTVACQAVIDEVSLFPKAGHDDLTDTVAQGLRWLRDMGGAQTREEADDEWDARNRYKKPRKVLYPCA